METPLFTMIAHSGLMVRFVLLILLAFSVLTWAVIINRYRFFRAAQGGDGRFMARYRETPLLAEVEQIDRQYRTGHAAQLVCAAAAEYRRMAEDIRLLHGTAHAKEDTRFYFQNNFSSVAERMGGVCSGIKASFDRGVFMLAMVSSISPFLGLLGTVWGIMNSFYEIGKQGSASLPVVAPGIAEALVATLAGLAVAIPALFFYNYFIHRAERLENEMDELNDVLIARLKREILENFFRGKRERQ
ncbi:MAG: MotA/TolQ/ExbB proton channel family protein [Chitinispirillaceae bacterium]|nr:MotA/TolQ/ExbB proton channel family protein [Chitinispirillaceae bacterium]